MKKVFVSMLAVLSFFYATAQTKPKVVAKPATAKPVAVNGTLKNLIDSFSYAAGYNVATNMKSQHIDKINVAVMQKAIDDVYKGKQPILNADQMNACMQKQMGEFSQSASAAEIAKGVAFLDANKKKPGVITLPDGLQYEVIKKGDPSGATPRLIDTVVVNYIGTLIDGKEFDNSFKRGKPVVFLPTGVIKGWTEILQMMRVGDKWKVYIPTELAYYLSPRDPNVIPPGAALIFEMTLEGLKPSTAQ